MKANRAIIVTLVVATIAQMFIPIAIHRTMFSYFVYIAVIASRGLFALKIFHMPINAKISPAIEVIAFALTMVFLFSAKFKKSFEINTGGMLINILIILVILVMMLLEEVMYVYVEKEVKDDNTSDK